MRSLVASSTNVSEGEHRTLVDAHFQRHATEWKDVYEQASVEGAIYRKRLAIVLEWIDTLAMPVGEKVLEIGCGSGRSAVALAQRGYLVHAVDSVEDMLNSTRQHAAEAGVSSSVSTSLGDAHILSFPESTFGLVLAIGVVPYLHSPEKCLREMARVLSPGGYLLVTAGNRFRLNYFINPWLFPPFQPVKRILRTLLRRSRIPESESKWPPIRSDSLRMLDRWISSACLTRIKTTTVGFPPIAIRSWRILGDRASVKLNERLQSLVDRNVPGIRSTGMDYMVLARKSEDRGQRRDNGRPTTEDRRRETEDGRPMT
jgi:ubiquinone/menaquinone biosynthesis C-methylase UbiE